MTLAKLSQRKAPVDWCCLSGKRRIVVAALHEAVSEKDADLAVAGTFLSVQRSVHFHQACMQLRTQTRTLLCRLRIAWTIVSAPLYADHAAVVWYVQVQSLLIGSPHVVEIHLDSNGVLCPGDALLLVMWF